MARCPRYVTPISVTENVGDSLVKINNNFWNLKEAVCDIIKTLDNTVEIRTFFYYGPNSSADSTSAMQNNVASRPSNTRIEDFINNPMDGLNLPQISKKNDIAFVIYQKTGFLMQQAVRQTSGTVFATGTSPAQNVPITSTNVPINNPSLTKAVPWSTTTPDRFTTFSPAFIIWRLTYNGTKYVTDSGFPKFSQAETASTPNWNNPLAWETY